MLCICSIILHLIIKKNHISITIESFKFKMSRLLLWSQSSLSDYWASCPITLDSRQDRVPTEDSLCDTRMQFVLHTKIQPVR